MRSWVSWCTLVVALVSGASAAPATLTVSKDGTLLIPPATVKKLGIRQQRGQLVCIQFPKPPPPKLAPAKKPHADHGHDHAHDVPAGDLTRPPKVYTGLGSDGGLKIQRTQARTASGPIPGKPGTRYKAALQNGILVLTPAK